MKNFSDISNKRWFMGKGKQVDSIQEIDSVELGDTRILILQVTFTDGEKNLYSWIEDENRTGEILKEAFIDGSTLSIFHGKTGYIGFKEYKNIPLKHFNDLKPSTAEQSNSAFFAPGKFFFKLYRRLLPGIHPEPEILKQLSHNHYKSVPEFLGSCKYMAESGKFYALGILEEHIQNAESAWDYFNQQMDIKAARELGRETARMHQALMGLEGTAPAEEKPPFEKLEKLLTMAKTESLESSASKEYFATQVNKVLEILPRIAANLPKNEGDVFQPQRIHGDFHLGQVLKTSDGYKILDFEGEPTRDLEFRRRLRSPAVDIAGMLRSFRYAAATSGKDCSAAEAAFLEGYCEISGIDVARLQKVAAPYVLAKAVYEACYELEFRPDWFWIPAEALISL